MELGTLDTAPRRGRHIGRWILLALVVLGGAGWAAYRYRSWRRFTATPAAASRPVGRVVPESLHVRVEVLNATGTRGLARQAMFAMRDAGFDVVSYGNSSEPQDSSLVLDRSGHADWAALAVRALGAARAEARPDTSRYLDLTILIGRRWTPPGEPLHP
ncbi:MAG: LytR C-terminal domain-containing protein [Gemmatimonadetes bacterium]|nr:LytR C-terminal domain-containing protein [Gemmatimonadota bacterium]MBI3568986.1 LytR C-terminal domain-containing protein [Gemmatimonadota bacterium]